MSKPNDPVKVLSLFDGMSCGMIALLNAGISIESYDAYEIDKYAIKTATHNFPQIKQCGDVFKADFTKYTDIDWLLGGSPCTYWSISRTTNRETTASGLGWELFSQYVRALNEVKPKYFIYENNKSMSAEIRASIDKVFGFDAICINSALVSAQTRYRLYWVGKRNDDGTYSKVHIEQPKDKHITVSDILDPIIDLNTLVSFDSIYINSIQKFSKRNKLKDLIGIDAYNSIDVPYSNKLIQVANIKTGSQGYRIYSCYGKSVTIMSQAGGFGAKTGLYICPISNNSIINNANIYTIKCGLIDIDNTEYPINLKDGKYIIRKLSIKECMKLQTVPEWYDFSCVSYTQAYKMLGNGWTCDVITHLIKSVYDSIK